MPAPSEAVDEMRQIMPFHPPALEQEFLRGFHERRRSVDILTSFLLLAMSVINLTSKHHYPWPMEAIGIITWFMVLMCALQPGYAKWRCTVLFIARLAASTYNHIRVQLFLSGAEAKTFLSWLHLIGFNYARFVFPISSSVIYQVPLRGLTLTGLIFTFILYIINSGEECGMAQTNPFFATYISRLEQIYDSWLTEGAVGACQSLCSEHLQKSSAIDLAVCEQRCSVVLPVACRWLGEPWLKACQTYRSTMVCCGCFIGASMLYLWEMSERWDFAKSKKLQVTGLSVTMRSGLPALLREAALNLATCILIFTQGL